MAAKSKKADTGRFLSRQLERFNWGGSTEAGGSSVSPKGSKTLAGG